MAATIAAIATPPGEGGIAIVRVSGDTAEAIFGQCFQPVSGHLPGPGRMAYGHVTGSGGEILDEVLGVRFAAPKTYTREDMFEIQCHGGRVCARRVLERVLSLGARIAQPGEFTRRAFENGRIDLSRAEAVMSLIGAGSEAAAKASLRQLDGGVSGFVRGCADRIKDLLALVEACTDFPDEVEETEAAQKVREGCLELRDSLLKRCGEKCARMIREGASVVLAGRPNVGKSSLMNALLAQERAIVTDIPGTTRDVLTEHIVLGGIAAELSDTAGRHETTDPVERIGVSRAEKAEENADIVILVLDASQNLTVEDERLLARRDERWITVLNKCDLPARADLPDALHVSCETGAGLDSLTEALSARLSVASDMEGLMTEERHIALTRASADDLAACVESIDSGVCLDVAQIDLKSALSRLCEITGENATEEVIDRVFSRFCVGK